MDTEKLPAPAEESQDDPFDLDVRIYPVFDVGDDEARTTTIPDGTSVVDCTSPGCG